MEIINLNIELITFLGFLGKVFKGISSGLGSIGKIGRMVLDPLQGLVGLKQGGQALGLWGGGKTKSTADSYGPESGTQFRSHLDAAFPELNPWEKAGAQQGGAGIIQSALNQETQKEGFGLQKEINAANLANNIHVAEIEKEKSENVAKIQAGATIEGSEIGADATKYSANIKAWMDKYGYDMQRENVLIQSDTAKITAETMAKAQIKAALGKQDAWRSFFATLGSAFEWIKQKGEKALNDWISDKKNQAKVNMLGSIHLFPEQGNKSNAENNPDQEVIDILKNPKSLSGKIISQSEKWKKGLIQQKKRTGLPYKGKKQ
jgi:hypothetical protein